MHAFNPNDPEPTKDEAMSRMKRLLGSAVAGLALAWATPGEALAGQIDLTDDPAVSGSAPGVVHFGSDFTVSGSAPVTQVTQAFTAFYGIAPLSIAGTAAFSLGLPYQVNADGSVDYQFGGSIAITGSVNGRASETIFQSSSVGGGTLLPFGGNGLFILRGVTVVGLLAPDVAAYFGGQRSAFGEIDLAFTPTGGGDYVLAGDHLSVILSLTPLAAVPEPASLGMVGGGLMIFGLIGRRIRRRI